MHYFTKRWRYLTRALNVYFRIYEADPAVAAGFRAQQIGAILRLTPLTMLANAVNAVALMIIFSDSPFFNYVALWVAVLSCIIYKGIYAWLIQRKHPTPERGTPARALTQRHQNMLRRSVPFGGTLAYSTFYVQTAADAHITC
ncbi:MAG: hypothetical protein U5M23_09725 [Marinagarivorans sp.]|nr:hypothetical protein [Marinagarivorans sp.]